MKVIILCGGTGTRLREETEFRPKPLVEVGGRPILWHIMKSYAHHGFRDFILCLGYRGSMIKEYFLNYEAMNNDFTICLGKTAQIVFNGGHEEQDFCVTLADTGLDTLTGGRLKRAARYLGDDQTFMLTYGDGLIDLDIAALLAFHRAHGKLATVTTFRPTSRFGVLTIDDRGAVDSFNEKPPADTWASAGYFVFERQVLDYLQEGDVSMEREPLQTLAAAGQLVAYRHQGFFFAMDTFREYQILNEHWNNGHAPRKKMGLINTNPWRDRTVFITGATGFLGGWLTHVLVQQGADVVALVRDTVPQAQSLPTAIHIVHGDIRDLALLERILGEYEINTVFHLAAQTVVGVAQRNPISTFESNIAGAWNLLEACRRSPLVKAIVVASSDKAYGDQADLPYTEDSPLLGLHPYDVSKACADRIAQSYAASYNLPLAITRCGNFFGGGDLNWNRITPGAIRSIIRGERPVIRSDGHYRRDYLYIEDAVTAYLALAARLWTHPHLHGQAFNFSSQTPLSVLELVHTILRLMHSPLQPDIRNEVSHEIRDQYLSAHRASDQLQWQPAFSLEDALRRTIDWYRARLRSPALALAHSRTR